MAAPTALIAEDEPLLANALRQALARCWPDLPAPHLAANGDEALAQALALLPDVLFLDIKMPGRSGLEVAGDLAEEWPAGRPFPLIVFVTAYDDYALQAFERAAIDYLLKPVSQDRLAVTVARLQGLLAQRAGSGQDSHLERALAQLRALSAPTVDDAPPRLDYIRAAVGNKVKMIPVDEVIYFEATDKYVNVVSAEGSALIRTSLRELIPQLDGRQFWQIHRGTVVQVRQIQAAMREESGKLFVTLRNRPEKLAVSRLFAHLFRQM